MRVELGLDRKNTDDLWSLHLQISQLLKQRIQQEKLRLEERLRLLRNEERLRLSGNPESARRPYPPVAPKYRNPNQPSETWAGRGKRPRWLIAQLRSGKRIDDFKIKKAANRR
jgi:DNA-binding protein H-NS